MPEGGYRAICIVGAGRSGSTLLERLLDATGLAVTVGELCQIWTRGIRDNEPCGCGRPFLECPFWSEVGERAVGGWESPLSARLAELSAQVAYIPQTPRRLLAPVEPRFDARLRKYGDGIARIHQAAADLSGGKVLIDASKSPAHAHILLQTATAGRKIHLLQLMRHPRAFAHSKARIRSRADRGEEAVLMHRSGSASAYGRWMVVNAFAAALVARSGGMRVTYDDLIGDPNAVVRRAFWSVGDFEVPDVAAKIPGDPGDAYVASLGWSHGISGNPSRAGLGQVRIAADEGWKGDDEGFRKVVGAPATALFEVLRRRTVATSPIPDRK